MELSGKLEWIRPKVWKMDWELRRDSETVATMYRQRSSGPPWEALSRDGVCARKGGLRRPGAAMNIVGDKTTSQSFPSTPGQGHHIVQGGLTSLGNAGPGDDWIVRRRSRVLFTVRRDIRSRRARGSHHRA